MLKAINESDKEISGWFDKIQLTCKFTTDVTSVKLLTCPADFLDQRQAAVFDPTDSRSLDLKYCAKILQPQQCYT